MITPLLVVGLVFAAEPRTIVWGAGYCTACRPMNALVDQVAADGWRISHHDVELERQAAEAWQITELPTIQVIADGVELERVVGRVDRAQLLAVMKRNGMKPPPVERRTLAWDTGQYL